jgi:transcriptional regulator with GAF, ATPase, and Fis domain
MLHKREQYNVDSDDSPIKAIIGESEIIKSIKAEIKLVAPTDAQVLITGETGVGKNLIAKVIHELHPRRKKYKFRRTNVGALVPELAASQLFGHVIRIPVVLLFLLIPNSCSSYDKKIQTQPDHNAFRCNSIV